MGKSKATPAASVDELVRNALRTIALAETPPKLTGKGGVFTSAAKGPSKHAVERLREGAFPLVVEQTSGKTATVSLTPAGFERVVADLSPDDIPEVVTRMACGMPPSARVTFLNRIAAQLPEKVAGLLALLEESLAEEKAEVEARQRESERRRTEEDASLAALERWKALLCARKDQRIAALKQELAAEGEPSTVDGGQPTNPGVSPATLHRPPSTTESPSAVHRPPSPTLPFPTVEEDIAFRRNVARRLVSAWVDAWDANNPQAREFLESAIWNVTGFRPIGEAGQHMTFDGLYHEGGPGLFTGDSVRVIRPGWVLEEADDREYVVLKAKVE